MENPAPKGARPVHQSRSAATSQRIVEALEDLLKEKHFEQITMAELASRAEITPGAIYRRFSNKEAFLPYIFERYRSELAAWLARVTVSRLKAETKNLGEALVILTSETLECFRNNRHIFRTVHLYGRLHTENAIDQAENDANAEFEPIGFLLKAFDIAPKIGRKKAAQFIGHTLLASCVERALYSEHLPARGLKISDKVFCRQLAEMFNAWLMTT